jgi:hypothetical protein
VLFVLAQGSAAAKVESTTTIRPTAAHHLQPLSLRARLARELRVLHKERSVVQFFQRHRWLLRSTEHGVVARRTFVRAERRTTLTVQHIVWLRHVLRARAVRHLRSAPPRVAICAVFKRDCAEALDVAWCESRLSTTAVNGQYLGLFQMGYTARRLFGHGPTAIAQSIAAHRYFVYSGRSWGPWSCKPSTY